MWRAMGEIFKGSNCIIEGKTQLFNISWQLLLLANFYIEFSDIVGYLEV